MDSTIYSVDQGTSEDPLYQPEQSGRVVLREQLQWLIRLRWIAVAVIVTAACIGSYIFPVLADPVPIYLCAGLLFLSNVVFYFGEARTGRPTGWRDLVWAMLQVEVDLMILTALLHFSGGVLNPVVLFYVFHVIMATILLPSSLSYWVGLSAVCLYGVMAVGELESWLRHHSLQINSAGQLWKDPFYVLWAVGAFMGMVVLSQYVTRTVISRVRAKEREIAKIQEMLRKSRIEMAEREKMVAIGQMASGVAHEIGNPLNSLSSVVQYLGRKLTAPEVKEQFKVIDQQINRISVILKRLLGLARPAEREYTWLDIDATIEDTLALIKYDERAREVEIRSVANDNLPTVWQKRHNLEQVFLNVFLNSLDAMRTEAPAGGHCLSVTRSLVNGMIRISIVDTGSGVDDEVLKQVFKPFFSTKEMGKGTGLGLYISRNLIEEIGGTMEMKANSGPGVTVNVNIPMGRAAEVGGIGGGAVSEEKQEVFEA